MNGAIVEGIPDGSVCHCCNSSVSLSLTSHAIDTMTVASFNRLAC